MVALSIEVYYARLWDTDTWQVIADMPVSYTPGTQRAVALNPSGTRLAHNGISRGLEIATVAPSPGTARARIAECIADTGIQTSLNARIEAGQWQAVINEVEALESTQITPECAAEIVEMARYFIENPPE